MSNFSFNKTFHEALFISKNVHKQFSEFENKIENFPEVSEVFNWGKNIWLFKPCDMNRGRGVQIFSELDDLIGMIMNGYYKNGRISEED